MIGHNLQSDEFDNHVYSATEEVLLEVKGVSGKLLKDISFELHRGEILAVTGLQGSGRDELADVLFGVEAYTGDILVKGVKMPNHSGSSTVKRYMKKGIGMVPRMRAERGIHNDLSVQDNLSMGFLNTRAKKLLINGKEEHERFLRQQKAMSIKVGSRKNPITSLSGGNQQ